MIRVPRNAGGRPGVAISQCQAVSEFLAESEDVFETAASAMIVLTGSFYMWNNLQFGNAQDAEIERVVRELLQPFQPAFEEEMAVEREVTKTLRQGFAEWKGHATIISGRRGSGKTWAWQSALKNAPGVAVVSMSAGQVPREAIAAEYGIDFWAFKEVLKQVKMKLAQTDGLLDVPVIVLEVQHATRRVVEGIHSFAKALSSDEQLAHVVVCDAGLVAPLFMLWGHRGAQVWVGELSPAEARALLDKQGCPEKELQRYIDSCGFYAADLASAVEGTLEDLCVRRWEVARGEVARFRRFKDLSCVHSFNGAELLNALHLAPGAQQLYGIGCYKVISWMEQNDCHAVVWHPVNLTYSFASEIHRRVAAENR